MGPGAALGRDAKKTVEELFIVKDGGAGGIRAERAGLGSRRERFRVVLLSAAAFFRVGSRVNLGMIGRLSDLRI